LCGPFAAVFTRPGWVRFVQWVTGMVLYWEEHTLTQIVTALDLESRWRVLEHFAEYGVWDREAQERPARWGRFHPVALDDTKLHRTSAKVWGTCTFHEQVEKRYVRRRAVGVEQRVGRGTAQAITAVLAATGGGTQINTVYIERLNATFRTSLAPLVRRGHALAHTEAMLTAGMWLVGCAYNCC
jgi:hypothetical protein